MSDEITGRTHVDEVPLTVREAARTDAATDDRRMRDVETHSAGPYETRPVLGEDERKRLRSRWETLQVGFVDDPTSAVDHARELVSEAVRVVTQGLVDAQNKLHQEMHRGPDLSTEDQRLAFQRYRAFLQHLIAL